MRFLLFSWFCSAREVYDTGLLLYIFEKSGIVFCCWHITESRFVGNGNMILSYAIEIDMRAMFFWCMFFVVMFLEIWLNRRDYHIWLVHTWDIHLVAHLMQIDITDVEEFIPYTSLIRLNRRYVMKFCESRVLHKYRPSHINNSSVGDNPDITVPVEDFVKHDKKHEKHIGFKQPEKWWIKYRRIPPTIDSPAYDTYREYEPKENIWKSSKKVSMKNRANLISFTEISFEKIVMHRRHELHYNAKFKRQNAKWPKFFTIVRAPLELLYDSPSKTSKLSQ